MSRFVQCLDLCKLFYHEIVQPVMDSGFPGLPYAAAVIGGGSEVLGFDDVISSDHDWGPHVTLFLNEDDYIQSGSVVHNALSDGLPPTFQGYLVNMKSDGPFSHDCRCTEVQTMRSFIHPYLNFDINNDIEQLDWLTFSEHKLRSITSGAVYHDDIGLQVLRDRFAYYPRDVWLYLILAGWNRVGQEEHLMGRAGSVGDELGAAIMASRLVRDLMRLCFLMERQYAPYCKWFGTAFGKLKCASELAITLREIQLAKTWGDREKHFSAAWEHIGMIHNNLGITEPIKVEYSSFFTRPYRVCNIRCNSGSFVEAIRAQIKDPNINRLAFRGLFGGIDQMSDNTDFLDNASWRHTLKGLYELASS